ncbi:hypothetical protein PGT21_024118 [Puccinia graminis f. sp. tritici]|uniref:Prolyl 4-hydroxylase alpha subunit Fe(2+) 2OG dioxygenase domain-containing protein n=1 Tax=Puccinia graminis f. sp. tritici TaxID=56615 RepID=A0A5B0MBZ5_PUCGR|nr:hypothetical protein PGT21_024118 [Puccinia graminis f. sp. tritici]
MARYSNYRSPDKFKKGLYEAFQAITTPGTYAAWEELATTPPAGLHVDGVGDIAMPLAEKRVRELIAYARQAPYGRRSKTLVDLSVRNTWEIDGARLRFLDPAWKRYLKSLAKRVAVLLGVDGRIRADLYKLLIYEKGAMFKSHTDTERTPGMFGTLVICLPSAHTGGEVVVKHNGQSKTLRTSDATQSFACWYSDVTHEVLPVKSGYRCVLTYNLVTQPDRPRPKASVVESQKDPLRKMLGSWLEDLAANSSTPSYLYHTLEHSYTEASISLKALKARDFARVQALQDLANELPFQIYLALVEKMEQGETEVPFPRKRPRFESDETEDEDADYHFFEVVLNEKHQVKSLHKLDGRIVARDYHLDIENFVEDDPFECVDGTEDHYEPYQGNWGPSAIHWFRWSAFVILPRRSLGNYLAECSGRDRYSTPRNMPVTFFDWAEEWLNTLPEAERAEKYRTWIPSIIHRHQSVADRIDFVKRISNFINNSALPARSFPDKSWADGVVHDIIKNLLKVTTKGSAVPNAADGNAIVSAIFRLDETWPAKLELITTLFEAFPQSQAVGFLLGLLSQLKTLGTAPQLPIPDNTELRRRLSLRLFNNERTPSTIITHSSKRGGEKQIVVTPQALVEFACDLHELSKDTDDLLESFILQINVHCPKFPGEGIRKAWIPFLCQLIPALDSRSISINTPLYQQLARQLVKYGDEKLGPCPQPDPNTPRPRIRCPCSDCVSLKRFLRDPNQVVGRFQLPQARRNHIYESLDEPGFDCIRKTEHIGRPHTLIVTKRLTLENKIKDWKNLRFEIYGPLAKNIQPELLEALLGVQGATVVQSLGGIQQEPAVSTTRAN